MTSSRERSGSMLVTQRRLGRPWLSSVTQGSKLSAKRCALRGRSLGSGEVARPIRQVDGLACRFPLAELIG